MFTIQFETDNVAFEDSDETRGTGQYPRDFEVARILRELAITISETSQASGGVYDVNGNKVGKWELS